MKKIMQGLRYSLTVMSHPIQGFYELRFENKGNIVSCFILLVLMILGYVCQAQYTAFIFNMNQLKYFNIIYPIINVVVPVALWCTANWSITVLLDGEGRFRDIFMATCYATVPMTVTTYLSVIISQFISKDEAAFVSIVSTIGMVYSLMLIFSGIMTVHQFSVTKNLVSILLSLIGMAFIAFLALLFAGLIDNFIRYFTGIVAELRLRM